MTKAKKIRGSNYLNERDKYTCKDCGEKFRLKATMRHHECIAKPKVNKRKPL